MKNKTLLQSLIDEDKIKVTTKEEVELLEFVPLGSDIQKPISFYPPGTKVTHFNGFKVEGYTVGNVIIDHLESTPLYNLTKRFINEETGHMDIHRYDNISSKFFSVVRNTKMWKLKIDLWDVQVSEDQEFLTTYGLFENNEFPVVHAKVITDMEYENKKYNIHKLTSFRIDEDFNSYYVLDNNINNYQAPLDLVLCVNSLRDTKDKETPEGYKAKIVPYMTIEK